MKGKDIVLLGFLYNATKYLRKKNSNYTCENYDDIDQDVAKIFNDNSLKNKSYFLAGESAFERYLKEKKNDTIDEFKDIFEDIEVNEIKNIVNTYKEVPHIDEDDTDEEELLRRISLAATNNINMMQQAREQTNVKELDRVFNEIVDYENEPKPVEVKEVAQKENKKMNRNDEYVYKLMQDLSNSKLNQKNHKNAVEKVKAYESIAKMYPYLQGSFIRNVYSLKDAIAHDYNIDEEIILLHRINFVEIESLRRFVEIVTSHDYTVNVDENKMIVDVLKGFVNEDGKILANIFDIANQAKVLLGEYEGFKVFEKEEIK